MKKKKRRINILIILLSVIATFLSFYYLINDKEKDNFLFNNIKDLSASISNLTSFSFTKSNYKNDLINEINNDYKNEIKNLKETLNLNTLNSDKKFINSTVIKRSTNFWYNIITIDKGKKDNIKVGEAVINNNGLIGKIIKVNNNTSDVKLLLSLTDENYISAMFNYNDNYYYGLISKYNYKANELTLKNVIGDFKNEDLKDKNVVTSGLSDSFTSGLLIGKIKKIKKDSFGISNEIIITPTVNFDNLNIVSVIVGDK